MQIIDRKVLFMIEQPGTFALRTLKGFRANQGLLLAGAVAYYALLSIVPLLILSVIAMSHWLPQDQLLQTLGRYLEWLVPGQSAAVVAELARFLAHREVMGWVLLVSCCSSARWPSRCWKARCRSSSTTAAGWRGATTSSRPSFPTSTSWC